MPVQAGEDVDSYCTKCKLVLAHVVIAMKEHVIARVECKTCRSIHTHRSATGTQRTAKRSTGSPKRTQGKLRATDYDQLMHGRDISQAKRYRIAERFDENDVVSHKLFGIGVVSNVLGDNKIEAIFPQGTKILVHNR